MLNIDIFPAEMRRGCQVCVIHSSFSFQTLHNDYSHIEDVHLLFCAHLINIFTFFMGGELRHFFHTKCVGGVLFV